MGGGATALAAGLELGKLMIVDRAPNVDNILLAAGGALGGVTVLPVLGRLRVVHAHGPALLVAGTVALLVYEELTPFTVVPSLAALWARVGRIEWVPFSSYYQADIQAGLFDLGKKLVLGAAVGAAMRAAQPRPRLSLVLLLAAVLEAAQVLEPVHVAATGDVLVIYAGAVAGCYLVDRQRLGGSGPGSG